MRAPLLLRATVAVGVVVATGVSLSRATTPSTDGLLLDSRATPVAVAQVASPVESCTVRQTVMPRSARQFASVVTVVNTGARPVKGWTLRWSYPGTDPRAVPRISDGWNATVATDGGGGQAIDLDPNATLPAGGSTTIGFVGTTLGTIPKVARFTLNGVPCR